MDGTVGKTGDDAPEINPEVARATGPQKGTSYEETDTDMVWKQCMLISAEIKKSQAKGKKLDYHYFQKKYSFMHLNYPSILRMLTTVNSEYEGLDKRMERIKQMLDAVRDAQSGKQTIEDVTTKIGQQYFDEFAPEALKKSS